MRSETFRLATSLAVVLLAILAAVGCEQAPPVPPFTEPTVAAPTPPLPPAPGAVVTPSVLPSPWVTATPLPPPTFSTVTFSAGFDEQAGLAIRPAKTFAYGQRVVFASWTSGNVPVGTTLDYEWYRNGTRVWTAGELVTAPRSRSFQALGYTTIPTMPLDAGEYQFQARLGDRTVMSDTFQIPSPVITGTNTLTIFFTVRNGVPSGYVIDKQGLTHAPAGNQPISDFYVSIGDRLVIRTDQSAFALLFDCGESPQLYSPCDFSADSPATLPTVLRKNRNGTATLNISRARNWGAPRPDFEPQRYPADPVLRIVLGD